VGVAKLEVREDSRRYKNKGNENMNQKQCIDDVRSFPHSKKLEEYGPGYVHTTNADPFGKDQEFLKCFKLIIWTVETVKERTIWIMTPKQTIFISLRFLQKI
jgi:hypothetical protein